MEVIQSLEPIAVPTIKPIHRALAWLGVAAWCVIVFFGCLRLYTRHNDFKIGFHPDEYSKARQLQQDYRNYNHPLLLLEATNWLMTWRNTPHDLKSIVYTGREASAIIAAVGVVGFALAGYFAADSVGMVLTSLAVGLCPSLLVYSHYMKEDAALIGGIGVTVAGMALVWRKRTIVAQLLGPMLAGAGAALAASGKYVGAVASVGALASVIAAPWRRWYWIFIRLLLAAAMAYFVVKAINHRAFEHWADFEEGFDNEYKHGTTGHTGMMLDPPTAFIWNVARIETQPHVQVFAVALLLAIVSRRRGWGWDLLLLLFTLCWLAVLSYTAIPFHRYGLPVVVLAHALAGLGAARWIEQLRPRRNYWIAVSVLAIALFAGLQGYRCRDFLNQFADDSRTRLRAWAKTNITRQTRFVQDSYADLPDNAWDNNVYYAAQNGSLDRLRRNGYTFVVVCDTNYSRYFVPGAHGEPGHTDQFRDRKAWYEKLFAEGKLVWQSKPDHPTYSFTNPEIRVYDLRK